MDRLKGLPKNLKMKTPAIVKKSKETARKAGKAVVNNPKKSIYVGLGIVVLVGGYLVIRGFSSGVKKGVNTITGENLDLNIDTNIKPNPSKTTISREQARIFASQLLKAFNYRKQVWLTPVYGTDDDVVEEIFKKITPEDFKLIYNEFGTKDYVVHGSPQEGIAGGILDFTGLSRKLDLVEWLKEEINSVTDRTLYNLIKSVVNQAGFAF